MYEIVEVKWIAYPKKSKVNLSKENVILKFTNGVSVKFYKPDSIKGLTNVSIGTKFHLVYWEDGVGQSGKEYSMRKAVSLKDKDLSKFINTYNPSDLIIENYMLYGLNITYYGDKEYDNWLCDNVLKLSRSNNERMSKLLYSAISEDPLKKSYEGYNFEEVKSSIYDKVVDIIKEDFDIGKAWNDLISIKSGRYTMFEGRSADSYFPGHWTD